MTTQSGSFLFFRTYIMDISYLLLMLLMLPVNVVGQASHQVAVVSKSIELRTSFDHDNAKDFTWTLKPKQEDYPIQIIKIQNDRVVENLNNRYKLSHNGTVLGINNLTKTDSGSYTAVVTMWNNSMKEEIFNVTVVDPVPTPKIKHEEETIGDQRNITLNCSIPSSTESNTTVIVIAVVVVALAVVGMVAFLTWWCKKRSSNPSEQDNQKYKVEEGENYKNENEENKVFTDDQDKGQADEDENKVKEPKNKDEQQNEDNLMRPVPEIGVQCSEAASQQIPRVEVYEIQMVSLNKRSKTCVRCREPAGQQIHPVEVCAIQIFSLNKRSSTASTGYHKVWSIPVYKNEVKKHNKEDEHLNKDENKEIQLQDTRKHRVWATVTYENEVKKYKKDEHRNKEENREIQLQETSYCDDRVQKNEVEEHEKKDDDENDEGHPLLEEIDATRVSKTRSTDREQPYMKSSVSQRQ